MITTPNGKNLMNLQEAVQWLLNNNALPFQCTANYVAGAEIGLGTIVNPSPAKVRVGSLIFFADSKVSTVIAITSNSFICSDEYNDLVDDVVYVSNVELNASGHLIVTLSNGDNIDAGLIKQVSNFSINASQHLIVSFNDGSSTDLGAIFNGNVNIAGRLTANKIIENMTGYSLKSKMAATYGKIDYAGVVKNGNKITFAIAGSFKLTARPSYEQLGVASIIIPYDVFDLLYPITALTALVGLNIISINNLVCATNLQSNTSIPCFVQKVTDGVDDWLTFHVHTNNLTDDTVYSFRFEQTFLLSDNLAA